MADVIFEKTEQIIILNFIYNNFMSYCLICNQVLTNQAKHKPI